MYGNGLHRPVRPCTYETVLERARTVPEPPAREGCFTDWAGIHTRIAMLPWAPQTLADTTSSDLPIPTDGYRSEAEEYVGLILSLTSNRSDYVVIEVGAGWAPWAVMGTVLARRQGKRARGLAIEADAERATWAVQHAADNGLSATLIDGETFAAAMLSESLAELTVVRAAAWSCRTTLRFPKLNAFDMGGAVNPTSHPTMDNRGAHFEYLDVPAVALEDVLENYPVVDLLHVDLQGFELEVLESALGVVESKVRFLAVGTHNRLVEGMLQELLLRREWALLMESPCAAVYDGVKPTLTGFTVQDGNQFYANSRFRDADPLVLR